jgi:hypothetical protein
MDLFKVLGSGAKFNKKRFFDDITLFEVFNYEVMLFTLVNININLIFLN